MKYIFFDTETTGVPKNYNAPISDIENWPRLVQLGFIVYNDKEVEYKAEYIIKPNGFTISEEVSKVHGIKQEIAEKDGVDINLVFNEFFMYLASCEKMVGHNISFDISVIGAEYYRLYQKDPFEGKDAICTMKSSTDFCKLPGFRGRYKWPKLYELHEALFHQPLAQTHTALDDIQNTAKCFFELERLGVIT